MSKRAVTLLELLAVIAILVILSALLFPTFAAAKRSALGATCTNNLNQLGTALAIYGSDNDNFLPTGSTADPGRRTAVPTYMDQLSVYLPTSAVYRCPLDHGIAMDDGWYGTRVDAYPSAFNVLGTSYMYELSGYAPFEAKVDELPNLSTALAIYDASGAWHVGAELLSDNLSLTEWIAAPRELGYQYNTLFFDGHVKSIPFDEWNAYRSN